MAVSFRVLPSVSFTVPFLLRVTFFAAGSLTVMSQVAVRLFPVVTVIVAVPSARPVTTPFPLTVATSGLLLFQVRAFFASEGVRETFRVSFLPATMVASVLFSVTAVGSGFQKLIVILPDAILL